MPNNRFSPTVWVVMKRLWKDVLIVLAATVGQFAALVWILELIRRE